MSVYENLFCNLKTVDNAFILLWLHLHINCMDWTWIISFGKFGDFDWIWSNISPIECVWFFFNLPLSYSKLHSYIHFRKKIGFIFIFKNSRRRYYIITRKGYKKIQVDHHPKNKKYLFLYLKPVKNTLKFNWMTFKCSQK